MKSWLIGGGILVVIVMWLVGTYNSFVGLNEDVSTAWAQVENQYQRRYDLVPNLVATVQGVAKQEQAVFVGVADARAKVGQLTVTPEVLSNPELFQKFQAAQGELSSALTRLMAVAENYPVLKSNENFMALQTSLEGTENRIATERMRYNDVVRTYNVKAKGIPGVFFVSLFGFDKERLLFEAAEGANTAPKVEFNIGS
ncbi:MAG TPA: LemA family protein [Candidatus Magasanikbacteria bacterium]|nr:LemA family protein [Candidatus Magasanikbacteria bacterium]